MQLISPFYRPPNEKPEAHDGRFPTVASVD
jgi:hypothetical protein